MSAVSEILIERPGADFDRWTDLLDLIKNAFTYMDSVIDPPSSATLLTTESLIAKAHSETCFLAFDGDRIVGCIYIAERSDCLYVGKLAVAEVMQGRGLGKALMRKAEILTLQCGKPALELQTRVELAANQAAFVRLGFRETVRTAHAGYTRPTSITMRKVL